MTTAKILKVVLIFVLCIVAYLFLIPFLFMFFTSFKTMSESLSTGGMFPRVWTLQNYVELMQNFAVAPIFRWMLNTFFVTVVGTALVLIVDTLAAYALARLKMPLAGTILIIIIWVMSIPGIVTVFPAFYLFKEIGINNTFIPLIFPYGANVLGVFMIYNFLKEFPVELEEAAFIDGASLLTILLKVVVPVIRPILLTLAFITFLQIYNDYLWPSLVVSSNEMKTITIGIASLVLGANFVNPGMMMAATLVAVSPALILFVFINQYIVRGATNSGIK